MSPRTSIAADCTLRAATNAPCGHEIIFTPCHAFKQRIQSRPLLTPFGTTDTLVAVNGHDGPAKPSGGLLQEL